MPTPISVITKIEALRFNTSETAYKILVSFIEICNSPAIHDAVVDKTIEICKQHKIKLPDAIIAATALIKMLSQNNLHISRNAIFRSLALEYCWFPKDAKPGDKGFKFK